MQKFKNILYVDHGLDKDRDSLLRVLELAERNNARLKGLIVCPTLPPDMAEYHEAYHQSLINTLQSGVREVQSMRHYDTPTLPISIEIASGGNPAINIIHAITEHGHDLLVKDAEPLETGNKGFKALDMKLLRKCPCPVWLNRHTHQLEHNGRVAVAIDPMVTEPEQVELAIRLLQLGHSIADNYDSNLHIVSCWNFEMENYLRHHVWINIEDDVLDEQIEATRIKHRATLDSLIHQSGIGGKMVIHHLHGSADEKIPELVNDEQVDVLVMGTVARSGIKGLVIGNTAENIVQSIPCSLVALKPQGFISPVT